MKIQDKDFHINWDIDNLKITNYEQLLIGSFNIAENFNLKFNRLPQPICGKQIDCQYFPFVVDKKEFLKLKVSGKKNKILLSKFIYLTCKKYYEIAQLYFKVEEFNQKPFKRLNETMYRETATTIEKIINEFDETSNNHLIGSLVQAYLQFWISIFKEMVQLTLDTFEFEDMYDEMANLTEIIQTQDQDTCSDFNTYVEQTIFQLISQKQVEAFNFFGLKPDCTREEFKKVYRKLSKKYHPDVAEGSEQIMQKINYYKIILDNYFNGEEDE